MEIFGCFSMYVKFVSFCALIYKVTSGHFKLNIVL